MLDPRLKKSDQVLILLYSETGWTDVDLLFSWVEYSNKSIFKSRVLLPLHRERLIEYSKESGSARITPKGTHDVEIRLAPSI